MELNCENCGKNRFGRSKHPFETYFKGLKIIESEEVNKVMPFTFANRITNGMGFSVTVILGNPRFLTN